MKLKTISSLLAASTIMVSGAAIADSQATLSNISGEVLVNQGESYITAQEGMPLNSGDQLMVMDGGQARVEFTDGCLHNMKGGDLYRISDKSACVVDPAQLSGSQYTQVQQGLGTGDKVVLGTIAVGGTAIALSGGDNNNNATGTGNN